MKYDPNKRIKSILYRAKKKTKIKTVKSIAFKKIYLESQARRMRRKMTKPEQEFRTILEEEKIQYETQKIVGFYIFDFYIPSINLLCEVDGDYYHSHPDKYKAEELNEMQVRNKYRDQKKNIIAKGSGYNLERFWEDEILNTPEITTKRLRELIKK